ncbi:MAG: hypothetical protein PF572_01385 [Patescibacteria group bacterium]|jgi:hypothetical protein|nr:hypothetical protein [Patescibacteria group bacterium]
MNLFKSFSGLFDSASHIHTGVDIVSSLTKAFSNKKDVAEKTKEVPTGEEKTTQKVAAAAVGIGDELNHASMVKKMNDPERSYYNLFKTELGEDSSLKERRLQEHLGTKYTQNPDEAIEEATEIGRIRGEKSSTDGYKTALFYVEAAGYTKDSNITLLTGICKDAKKKIEPHLPPKRVVKKRLNNFEKSVDNFLGNRYGENNRVKWGSDGKKIKK